ncbi:hypothetical protein ANN_01522 [Periplaneta americana]|uniref:Uncharacterized protein n=1 Tax=Periplaneta americana TaxID=6978 RepID=A0ABQ8TTT9_PERAM|nr:hypothetical protein ANN_01522 [Periplaneta americana]
MQIHPVGLQSVNGTLILRQDSLQAVAISSAQTTVAASPKNREQRRNVCMSMQTLIENDDEFIRSVVFSDEATFHLSGKMNRHNLSIWGSENPRTYVELDIGLMRGRRRNPVREAAISWVGPQTPEILTPPDFLV